MCGIDDRQTFASGQAAWEALPYPLRYGIEGRRATFDFTGRKHTVPLTQEEVNRHPSVMHSIWVHSAAGAGCPHVNLVDSAGEIERTCGHIIVCAVDDVGARL